MRAVVTGAAGFIGSTLTDALLEAGHRVLGVDCFSHYYDPAVKRANVAGARRNPAFELVQADLRTADLAPIVRGADVVFHQAAQPGVRLSWAAGFTEYDSHNVLATQRVLEAARSVGVGRLVYASSSSAYGNAPRYPTLEYDLPRPHSPYGVTKLAGEHLCAGHDIALDRKRPQPGDVRETRGSIERAEELLSWYPRTTLEDGLRAQVRWQRDDLTDRPELDHG